VRQVVGSKAMMSLHRLHRLHPFSVRHLGLRAVCGGLAALAVLVATPVQAQAPLSAVENAAVQLRDRAAADPTAWDFVEGLTTEIGPRLAGTPAERRAAEWSAARLRRLGFDRVTIEDFPLAAWIRGREEGTILGPNPQALHLDALGGSASTPPGGIEGEVVMFDTVDALAAAPAGSLRGKIAMVNRRMTRTQTGQGYGPTVAGRSRGPAEAARAGAAAFLLRSVGTDSHRFPHTGATAYGEGGRPILPAAAVSNPDADQIERLARRAPVRVRLTLDSTLQPASRSQNVVAEIRGRERPEEVVLLGCHLDSWDQGTGAVDDAAGCAIITGAAKLIADLPQSPRRTLRVVLFGAEEVSQPDVPGLYAGGLSGARFHAARADAPGVVLASESDFGAGRIYAAALPAGWAASDWGRAFGRVVLPAGVLLETAPAQGGGPDIGPIQQAHGTPVARLQQDGTDYFDLHHTPDDTLDKIERAALDQNVAVWAAFAWMAAESDADFRSPPPAAPARP